MGKSTISMDISMAIFNSKLLNYQRVLPLLLPVVWVDRLKHDCLSKYGSDLEFFTRFHPAEGDTRFTTRKSPHHVASYTTMFDP